MIKSVLERAQLIQLAMAKFKQSIDMGQVLIPQNLPIADEDSVALFPDSLIINQMIVPIIYDKDTNTISLDLIRSGS